MKQLKSMYRGKVMYTIKAKPITIENFKPYGTFASMLEPTGPSLGDFYNDQVVVFHIIYNFMLHIIYHRFRNCHSGFSTLFNPNYAY